MGKLVDFDAEKVYDEQISPLMAQIIKICVKNKIPHLCTFAYKYEENPEGDHGAERTSFCTTFANNFKGREAKRLEMAINALQRTYSGLMAFTVGPTPAESPTPEGAA